SLEALFDLPGGDPRAAAVFAHPHPLHGGTMHTKAVYQAAKALVVIDGADHLFDSRTSEVGDAVEDLLADGVAKPADEPKE
ncbi:MAG: hypothetical protein ACT4QD_03945, partial [Acidobacteriota bacterium]